MAAKQAGKWYGGVLEASERFFVRWREHEAKLRKKRHASVMGGAQEKLGGKGEES